MAYTLHRFARRRRMGLTTGMEFRTPMQSTSIAAITARPRLRRIAIAVIAVTAVTTVPLVRAQSLMGSRDSLLRQNAEAQDHDFTYLRTSSDVRSFASKGLLVRLRGNSDYRLASDYVSFPYARPEVKLFI